MTRHSAVFGGSAAGFALLLAFAPTARAGITVNYTVGSALQNDPDSALIQAAFARAATNWTNLFTNTFTLNLTIDFTALGGSTLGVTNPTRNYYAYSDFRTALASGMASADDQAAVATLAAGSTFSRLINRTSDNPNGAGSATPYVDRSQTQVRMTSANAKALGLIDGRSGGTDAAISFSSNQRTSFDFNPDDGIESGLLDFVGLATHEIGHALGYLSGVDTLEVNSPPQGGPFPAASLPFTTPLDFFRYSDLSAQTEGGILDFTADTRDKYFSLDKQPSSALFSTGRYFGDGRQASHWKDDRGIGIMDPTFARGELGVITTSDLRAFDAIGYNVSATATAAPEPASLLLTLPICALGIACGHRRRNG